MACAFGGNNTAGEINVATAVNAHGGPTGRLDFESETFVAHYLRADGFDASEDGTGRGTPLIPIQNATRGQDQNGLGIGGDVMFTLDQASQHAIAQPIAFAENSRAELRLCGGDGTVSSQLTTGGGKPGQGQPCIAFSCKDHGADAGAIAPTLRSMGHNHSHANAGGQLAIAIQERAVCENPDAGPDGIGVRDDGVSYTLEARTVPQAVAFTQNQTVDVLTGEVMHSLQTNSNATGRSSPNVAVAFQSSQSGVRIDDVHATLDSNNGSRRHNGIVTNWAVRRLTPTECERLQGFPDGYTNVPWRGKASTPDGPRYKALGNSMAVNCMRWIGMRIQLVSDIANTVPKTNHRLAS